MTPPPYLVLWIMLLDHFRASAFPESNTQAIYITQK